MTRAMTHAVKKGWMKTEESALAHVPISSHELRELFFARHAVVLSVWRTYGDLSRYEKMRYDLQMKSCIDV